MGERWVDQGTQLHACTSTQSHTYTRTHTNAHTHTCLQAHAWMHTCTHTHNTLMCVHVNTCVCTHVHTHIHVDIQMRMHACASTCTCTSSKGQIISLSTLLLPFEMLHSTLLGQGNPESDRRETRPTDPGISFYEDRKHYRLSQKASPKKH